jgi:hypothetical protein
VPDDALLKVVFRAMKDEGFFKRLEKDPAATVREAGIKLSEQELEHLREAMKSPSTVTVYLPDFLREVHQKHLLGGLGDDGWVSLAWVVGFKPRKD